MTINENPTVVVETNSGEMKEFEKFGKFQIFQYFFISLTIFMISMSHVNYVFVAENINYRCRVHECETPQSTAETPSWWPKNIDSKCLKPKLLLKEKYMHSTSLGCTNSSFSVYGEDCNTWIYENNNSLVSELDLACQPLKVSLIGGIHNTGMAVSMFFAGWLSDKIGRKPTLIISSVGACIGTFKIFVKDYYQYLFLEFMESAMGTGIYTVGIVLLMEIGIQSKRVLAGVVFCYACYSGEIGIVILAMALQYWKWLILAIYSPMILFSTYIFLLKESTRWQMLRGKTEEAKKTLKAIIRINKLNMNTKVIDDYTDEELRSRFDVEDQKEKESIKVIIHSKVIMTRLAVTALCFFTSSFLYYGAVVHSVLLPGNKYTNFVLSALSSFPGDLITYFAFVKYGRKITLQCGYAASAIFLIAQGFTPASLTGLKIMLFLVGKVSMVICFTGIYTYSLELFPTSVRGTLLGCCNTVARFGSMLAPLTPLLANKIEALPSIIFSVTSILPALLLTFTPETKTLPIFDTIAQIESYESSQSKIST